MPYLVEADVMECLLVMEADVIGEVSVGMEVDLMCPT